MSATPAPPGVMTGSCGCVLMQGPGVVTRKTGYLCSGCATTIRVTVDPCPAWKDGAHLFGLDVDGDDEKKVCACGATVART